MPVPPPESLIFEPFIETDEIIISNKLENGSARHLVWKGENDWLEITVGVVGKRGEMHSLNPSITVKESGDILSLEEKFQGKYHSESVCTTISGLIFRSCYCTVGCAMLLNFICAAQ